MNKTSEGDDVSEVFLCSSVSARVSCRWILKAMTKDGDAHYHAFIAIYWGFRTTKRQRAVLPGQLTTE